MKRLAVALVLAVLAPLAQAAQPIRYTDEFPGFEVFPCDGFEIFNDAWVRFEITDYFDNDGYWIRTQIHSTAMDDYYRADDPDGTDTVSYSLDDSASGRFAIDGVTGEVTVAGGIDREAAGTYDIIVRATSSDTSTTTRTFTIAIGDVDGNVRRVQEQTARARDELGALELEG